MVALNPLRSLLSPEQIEAENKLHAKFRDDEMKRLAKQWSQLIAWSWLEPTDYVETLPEENEEKLRQSFIKTVKRLASVNIQGLYEEDLDIDVFEERSNDLSNLLDGTESPGELKLPALYRSITNKEDYIFTQQVGDKKFVDHFLWGILIDRFTGVCVDYLTEKDKFVVLLAYPPRPPLSPSTLTANDLYEWTRDQGAGYLHPNPYIPTCNC